MEIISDAEGRQKATVMADAVLALPLLLIATIQGKALRPLLAKMTGLSETRIAKGNLGSLRPATQRRVSARAREMTFQEGRRNGVSAEEVKLRLAELKAVEHEPWESFAVMLMVREVDLIPHARSVGVTTVGDWERWLFFAALKSRSCIAPQSTGSCGRHWQLKAIVQGGLSI